MALKMASNSIDTDTNTDLDIFIKSLIESSLPSYSNFSLSDDGKLEVRIPKGLKHVKSRRRDAPDLRSRLFSIPAVGRGYGNCVPPVMSEEPKEKGYYWWVAQGIHYGVKIRADREGMMEEIREVMRRGEFRVPKELLGLEKELKRKGAEKGKTQGKGMEKVKKRTGSRKIRVVSGRLVKKKEVSEEDDGEQGEQDEELDDSVEANDGADQDPMMTDLEDGEESTGLTFDDDGEPIGVSQTLRDETSDDEEDQMDMDQTVNPDLYTGTSRGALPLATNIDRPRLPIIQSPSGLVSGVPKARKNETDERKLKNKTRKQGPLDFQRQKKAERIQKRDQRRLIAASRREASTAIRNDVPKPPRKRHVRSKKDRKTQNLVPPASGRSSPSPDEQTGLSTVVAGDVLTRFRSMTVSLHGLEIDAHRSQGQTPGIGKASVIADDAILHPDEGKLRPTYQIQLENKGRASALATPVRALQKSTEGNGGSSSPSNDGYEVSPAFYTTPTGSKRRRESDESIIHIESRPVKRKIKALPTASDEVIELSSGEDTSSSRGSDSSEDVESEPESESSGAGHNLTNHDSTATSSRPEGHGKDKDAERNAEQVARPGSSIWNVPAARHQGPASSADDNVKRAQVIARRLSNDTGTSAFTVSRTQPIAHIDATLKRNDLSTRAPLGSDQDHQLLDHISSQSSIPPRVHESAGNSIEDGGYVADKMIEPETPHAERTSSYTAHNSGTSKVPPAVQREPGSSQIVQQPEMRTPARRVGMLAIENSHAKSDRSELPSLSELIYPRERGAPLDGSIAFPLSADFNPSNGKQLHPAALSHDFTYTSTSRPKQSARFGASTGMRRSQKDHHAFNTPFRSDPAPFPASYLSTYPKNIEIKSPTLPRSAPRAQSQKRTFEVMSSYSPDAELYLDREKNHDHHAYQSQSTTSFDQDREGSIRDFVSERGARRLAREMGIARSIE